MPRGARLDVLGVVQHVMARGMDGEVIFTDARDREVFLGRLEQVVTAGGAQLLGWALMSNHLHLVLRPQRLYLKDLMRRLLTGYAGWFNRRHQRRGHVFQNRYRSIVVEEEPYLLALVRYVHLNPLRAGLVADLAELDRYPYTGHAVVLGQAALAAQDVAELLAHFGEAPEAARRAYCAFVADGVGEGSREEFRGGGMVRSSGGWAELKGRRPEEREEGDARILGSGAFVASILGEEERTRSPAALKTVDEVLAAVAREWEVDAAEILGPSRRRHVAAARREFFRRAYRETAATMAELARCAGRTQPAVWQAVRGEE